MECIEGVVTVPCSKQSLRQDHVHATGGLVLVAEEDCKALGKLAPLSLRTDYRTTLEIEPDKKMLNEGTT